MAAGPGRAAGRIGTDCRRLVLLTTTPAFLRCRFFGRDNRQQNIRLPNGAEVQAGNATEDMRGTVARIVVQERAATRQLVLEVRELAAARAGINIIFAADGKADAMAGRYDDRGRPDLDIELGHLPFLERLDPVVAVVGPVGRGEFFVEP